MMSHYATKLEHPYHYIYTFPIQVSGHPRPDINNICIDITHFLQPNLKINDQGIGITKMIAFESQRYHKRPRSPLISTIARIPSPPRSNTPQKTAPALLIINIFSVNRPRPSVSRPATPCPVGSQIRRGSRKMQICRTM